MKGIKRAIRYVVALGLVPLLALFVWMAELALFPVSGAMLTNGFVTVTALQMYHVTMYLAFSAAFLAALTAIWSLQERDGLSG